MAKNENILAKMVEIADDKEKYNNFLLNVSDVALELEELNVTSAHNISFENKSAIMDSAPYGFKMRFR